jgi:hypothetical protein
MKKPAPVDDDPPPPISQNHYRHIHEQRDFTMENLSMSGETELADYEEKDMKIFLEDVNELDRDIQDLISNDLDLELEFDKLTPQQK